VLNTTHRRIDRKGPFPVPLWWLSHHSHPAARYSRDLCSEKFHLTRLPGYCTSQPQRVVRRCGALKIGILLADISRMERRLNPPLAVVTLLALVPACFSDFSDSTPASTDDNEIDGKADGVANATDIVTTKLGLDFATKQGRATLTFARRGTVSLEAAGLTIRTVRDASGSKTFRVRAGRLIVRDVISPLLVDYGFSQHENSDGLLAGGSTVIWPYFCGNLFPCDSRPSDGTTFEIDITGIPSNQRALYPHLITAEAPAYQMAFAVGDYTTKALGTTAAGTRVSVSWLPGGQAAAIEGTKHLTKAFDWFERNLGPYRFGSDVGSVAAKWGGGAFGGMEHHPLWHVATDAMSNQETHVHEAAHGWFGDGIRIKCWEDFVLSEGTVSYLAARAIGQVDGAAAEKDIWRGYQDELDTARADGDRVAWPTGCNKVDILKDGLFSSFPYMEGAFFYKDVATAVGVATLDRVLSKFYMAHRGQAAGMADMIALIKSETGFDPSALVAKWLR
jgi:hypothetical protein